MSLSFTGRCCACLALLCFTAVGTAQPVEPAVAKAKNNHDSTQFTTVDPAGYLPDWLTKKTALGDIEWTIDKFRSWLEQQAGVPVVIDYNGLDIEQDLILNLPGGDHEQPLYLIIQRAVQLIPGAAFSFEEGRVSIVPRFRSESTGVGRLHCFDLGPLKEAGYELRFLSPARQRFFWHRPGTQRAPELIGNTLVGRMDEWEAAFTHAFLDSLKSENPAMFVFLPEEDRQLLSLLDTPVNAEFTDTPLDAILSGISKQIGVPINYVEATLSTAGILDTQSATVSFQNLKLIELPRALQGVVPRTHAYPNNPNTTRDYRLILGPAGGQLLLTTNRSLNLLNLRWCAIHTVRNGEVADRELQGLVELINKQIINRYHPKARLPGGIAPLALSLGKGRLAVFEHWQVQREVAEFLRSYEQAVPERQQVDAAPPPKKNSKTDTYEVRFYPMSEELANSLQHSLPKLVNGRWEEGFNAANGPHYGQAAAITDNGKTMLAIRQTKEVHEQVEEFLKNYAAAGKAAPEVEAGGETSQSEKTPTSPE
ncbi:hypothetical protein [Rubinisphaera brasiliensis]|uniref:Uncharacterized protein n=1 Tax=Rubinisphaera brasiliensis (strain ATCC 49424 / DSM 5305 / JCM 21570 / IAM 15109 / NBRC 103401 / IFAM 1448) TaxID=756272 RepID=F0SJV1_RUBBR|nr:hypothetical protein [Rubinisphaera brasiliensis]ADY58640.1 hypothetical protein Plabr_1019 [Rubinisphaera brasiliensis DSM 5305]